MMCEHNSVLFVCLGNICRSPIAAAVFKHLLVLKGLERNWTVESAGLGSWHIGNPMDQRSEKVLQDRGVDTTHKARQITTDDFRNFDYIFGMDNENIKALKSRAPRNSKAKIDFLGSYDPKGEKIIEDPYFDSGNQGFIKCYEQCYRSSEAFLSSFEKNI